VPVFVDTNVLVYARDSSEPEKQPRAQEWLTKLWTSGQGRLSTQVLEEYYVTTTRKLQPGLHPDNARADVLELRSWQPIAMNVEVLRSAWGFEDRFGLSFWDSLIVAAAHATSCEHLLSEDLQHDMEFDGLRVLNPFVAHPETVDR
jgi:predicted nucleic acid-binding protein